MASCLSPELFVKYPVVYPLIFTSTADSGSKLSDNWVVDSNIGYIEEMERAGQHATAPGSNAVLESPYSTRLRPNTNLQSLFAKKGVPMIIESIQFVAYDSTLETPTLLEPVSTNPYQVAAVVADMITSQATDMDANMASHFRNGIAGNWQPNWFRPQIIVNGKNILASLIQTEHVTADGHRAHRGDLSMGLALPWLLELAMEFPNGITSLEIFGQVVQYIAQTAQARKYVRYPLQALVMIRTAEQ